MHLRVLTEVDTVWWHGNRIIHSRLYVEFKHEFKPLDKFSFKDELLFKLGDTIKKLDHVCEGYLQFYLCR